MGLGLYRMNGHEGRRRDLEASLEAHETELAGLRLCEKDLERKVEELRDQLRGLERIRPDVPAYAPPKAPDRFDVHEKVALFRSLFRGREDVFPWLSVNSKTGHS